MTAKEDLGQAWHIKKRMSSLSEQLAYLRSAAEYVSPQFSETPKAPFPNVHANENAIMSILDFEERLQKQYAKLNEIVCAISGLADPEAQSVVFKRYLEQKTWQEIASETFVSVRQAHRLHQMGIDEIEQKLWSA